MSEDKPYVPFYKPYGMTDEEYQDEVRKAQKRLEDWKVEQAEIQMIEDEIQKEKK